MFWVNGFRNVTLNDTSEIVWPPPFLCKTKIEAYSFRNIILPTQFCLFIAMHKNNPLPNIEKGRKSISNSH